MITPLSAATLAANAIGIGKEAANMLGSLEDGVEVEVWGNGPNTPKRLLFQCAAATAFGLVKRLGPAGALIPPPGMVAVQYDAADNYLKFSLRYSNSLVAILVANSKLLGGAVGGPAGGTDTLFHKMPVLSGPEDTVTGGPWTFHGPGIHFPLVGDIVLNVPKLKFEGKTILTKDEVSVPPHPEVAGMGAARTINPRPAADQRSRSAWVNLVWSCLTQPGVQFNMTFPEPHGGADGLEAFRGA